MMKKVKVISCLITIFVMALIFFFSSQTASVSSETSSGITKIVANIISSLIPRLSADFVYNAIHTLIRKTAHFTLFFMLGLSVANTASVVFSLKSGKLLACSVAFCILYAISDELHQIAIPGRAAMVGDVLIDTLGSLCAVTIYILVKNIYVRRKKNDI